jgi:hypothetical protein
MTRTITLLALTQFAAAVLAASGGPDQYGYTWKDSNEPGGPVYEWIDITQTGTLVTGLADDNIVGPYTMGENFPFYWYGVKKVFIGSNGYITFITSGNIAAPFPFIPAPGGTDNFIAGFMTDLNFSDYGGANPVDNPAQCYWQDGLDKAVFSFINVPYWNSLPPLFTGSNTFQIVLNKLDSTITVNYQTAPCCSGSNGPICGIEAINGDIGLMQNTGIYPVDGFSVRFYPPAVPLLDITDASVEWVTDETNGAWSLPVDGTPFPLHTYIRNTGNQPVQDFTVTSTIFNANNQPVAVDASNVGQLLPGQTSDIFFANSFVPSAAGTYRSVTTLSGITGETVTTNNSLTQELVAYDTTQLTNDVDWAGPLDDGIGIGWNGGEAGCGVYIEPPFHPIYVSHTTCRIVSNFGNVPFTMRVYDDNGPNGGPGTLLDSVFVSAAEGQAGNHIYPLANPFLLESGGLYVLWYMGGQNVNLAQDVTPPFSLRTYEVIQGAWAEYRDREAADFHLGLRMGQLPEPDAGASTMDQPDDGQVIGGSTAVRIWLRNFGNIPVSGIPCGYRFAANTAVTQTYNGPAIPPGDSTLFMFAQPLVPFQNAAGELCAWSSLNGDVDAANDTVCVNITLAVGLEEQALAPLRIWPVPAQDVLFLDGLPSGLQRVEVYDMTGALRLVRALRPGRMLDRIPVTELPPGAYVLRAIGEGGTLNGRFTVQR